MYRIVFGGVSQNEIAGAVGLARSTVQKYIQRAREAGITWPLPEGMSADKLDAVLFPRPLPPVEAGQGKALPDWERVAEQGQIESPGQSRQRAGGESPLQGKG